MTRHLSILIALARALPLVSAETPAPQPTTPAAPAAPATSDIEARKAKVEAAEQALNAAYKAIDADPEIAALDTTADAARDAYYVALKADGSYGAAKTAEDDAKKAYDALLDTKLAADPEVGPLLAERDAARKAEEEARAAEKSADEAKDKTAKDAAGPAKRAAEARRKAAEAKLKHPRRAAVARLESGQDPDVSAGKEKRDAAVAARKAIEEGEAQKAHKDAVDLKRASSQAVQDAKQAVEVARAELKAAAPQ
jgi:colicin import membrane protein